ncbi:MAG: hypothetical protein HZB45_15170 [Mycolicibacterium rufum]|nr:hypothetical protein [Mycolicibacterium rufum]
MTVDTDTTDADTASDAATNEHAEADELDTDADRDDDQDQDDDDGQDDEGRGGNSEAAKWRHKTREVESERDALRDQLTAQRRAVLAAAAAAKRVSPELVAKTVELDELLDENGLLDPARAVAAIDEVITTYGLPDRRPDGSGGKSREGGTKAERVGWGSVLRGNARTQR